MNLRLAALSLGIVVGSSACLDRPVVPIRPACGGISFTKLRITRVDKVDMLLVIDNSISMADKQSELGRRMPELIAALTDPTPDAKTGKPANVLDMHVGVITSSLGSHGTSACAVEITNAHNNDHARLLPRPGEGGGSGWKVDKIGGEPTSSACPAPVAASPLSWVYDPGKEAQFKGYPEGAEGSSARSASAIHT